MSYYAFSSGNICQNLDLFPELSVYKPWLNTSGVLNIFHNNAASVSLLNESSNPTSKQLWVRDFRLNIPVNTRILSINANLVRESSRYGSIEDSAALITFPSSHPRGFSWLIFGKSGTGGWGNKWASFITSQTYSSLADYEMSQKTWTAAEVNSPNFGFGISVYNPDYNSDIAYVYQVELTVYYEFLPPVINYIYPSGGAKVSNRLNSSVYSFNSKYIGIAKVKTSGAANVLIKCNSTISGGAKFAGQSLEALNKIYSEISSGGAKFAGQASEFLNIVSLVEIKIGGLIDDNIITNNIVESNGLSLSGKATNEIIVEHSAYGG